MTTGTDWAKDVAEGALVVVKLPRAALEVLAGYQPVKSAELTDAQALLRAALGVAS